MVSCALKLSNQEDIHSFWLLDSPVSKGILHTLLYKIKDTHVIVCFNAIAEGRCFLALGLDVRDFTWIDLYCEWKMLTNHCHKFQYGRQLIKGKEVFTKPPKNKWDRTEEDNEAISSSKAEHNLGSAVFKLLNKRIDNERKNRVRHVIISGDLDLIEEHRDEIIEYNESDIEHLPKLLNQVQKAYKFLFKNNREILKGMKSEMLFRGDYSARTAIIERLGQPIDYDRLKNLSSNVNNILMECQRDINKQFPDLKPFKFNKREMRFNWKQKDTKEYLEKNLTRSQLEGWLKTDSGAMSLKLDAFTKYFDFKHEYPEGNFGAQMVRFLKLRQSLNGFSPASKNSFWDTVGTDKRSRPFLNIYGSQAGRNQPKATGFLFLKPAWMRSLMVPSPGNCVIGIDYGSQEFLLGGLLSGDREMIDAYHSGDPYLYFGKKYEAIPQTGTKQSHPVERYEMKQTVLSIQYKMGAIGLANSLSQKGNREYTKEEAQDFIDGFNSIFHKYAEWCEDIRYTYEVEEFIKLPCGWVMFGDNDNFRSIMNMPVQGTASTILRYAIRNAQDRKLAVIQSLHDALYTEAPINNWEYHVDQLYIAMDEAFREVFKDDENLDYANCRMDADVWSPEMEEGKGKTPLGVSYKIQKMYVDERATNEFERFGKYLNKDMSVLEDL
jgi:hypothetical protein